MGHSGCPTERAFSHGARAERGKTAISARHIEMARKRRRPRRSTQQPRRASQPAGAPHYGMARRRCCDRPVAARMVRGADRPSTRPFGGHSDCLDNAVDGCAFSRRFTFPRLTYRTLELVIKGSSKANPHTHQNSNAAVKILDALTRSWCGSRGGEGRLRRDADGTPRLHPSGKHD